MLASKIALRTFVQSMRKKELKVMLLALILAVATMTGIGLFINVLNTSLLAGSADLLGGDRQLTSSRPVDENWITQAENRGLKTAYGLSFPTMLISGEKMALVSARAVNGNFPLKGVIDVRASLFSAEVENNDGENATGLVSDLNKAVSKTKGPSAGKIWLSERLFGLLDIVPGGVVILGNTSLIAEKVLVSEPDVRFGMSALSPRVLMNVADIESTGVVQAGSRVSYTWYFAGEDAQLDAYFQDIAPAMQSWHQWQSVKEGRPSVATALDKAESYLYLAGGLTMLLAITAIMLSARQFGQSQIRHVGLLRALGLSGKSLIGIYTQLLAVIGIVGALLGGGVGIALFFAGHYLLAEVFAFASVAQIPFAEVGTALAKGVVVALVCVYAASVPLWLSMRAVSPMVILRAQTGEPTKVSLWAMLPGMLVVIAIVAWFNQNIPLTIGLFVTLFILFMVIAGMVFIALRWLRRWLAATSAISESGSAMRMAASNLEKYRWQSAFQIFSFSVTLTVLISMVLVRTGLVEEWRAQLPENAPNHFLINISQRDIEDLSGFFIANDINFEAIYPMVRGRLTHINGREVKEAVTKEENVGALNRELNLSWTSQLPEGNQVELGKWWGTAEGDCAECVSVESRLAERLDLKLGDALTFTIGSEPVTAKVSSLRSVQWDSMRPNFYMLFPPGLLNGFPETYISSFYLPAESKLLLNELGKRFPTISILEIDEIIARIEIIMQRVTTAIEMLLVLVILASLLVMVALVNTTMSARGQQVAIVRALGGSRSMILKTQWSEFVLLGGSAAVTAYLGAEAIVNGAMYVLFSSPLSLHLFAGLSLASLGAVVITFVGVGQVRAVLNVPPGRVLREV